MSSLALSQSLSKSLAFGPLVYNKSNKNQQNRLKALKTNIHRQMNPFWKLISNTFLPYVQWFQRGLSAPVTNKAKARAICGQFPKLLRPKSKLADSSCYESWDPLNDHGGGYTAYYCNSIKIESSKGGVRVTRPTDVHHKEDDVQQI